MGDTQRSPTISTENQGIAAKIAGDSGHGTDLDRQGRGEKEADRYTGFGG
jgi:hypothetical protein